MFADRVVFAVAVVLMLVFTGYLFGANLQRWCDTPEVGQNKIVQPLCNV